MAPLTFGIRGSRCAVARGCVDVFEGLGWYPSAASLSFSAYKTGLRRAGITAYPRRYCSKACRQPRFSQSPNL